MDPMHMILEQHDPGDYNWAKVPILEPAGTTADWDWRCILIP